MLVLTKPITLTIDSLAGSSQFARKNNHSLPASSRFWLGPSGFLNLSYHHHFKGTNKKHQHQQINILPDILLKFSNVMGYVSAYSYNLQSLIKGSDSTDHQRGVSNEYKQKLDERKRRGLITSPPSTNFIPPSPSHPSRLRASRFFPPRHARLAK